MRSTSASRALAIAATIALGLSLTSCASPALAPNQEVNANGDLIPYSGPLNQPIPLSPRSIEVVDQHHLRLVLSNAAIPPTCTRYSLTLDESANEVAFELHAGMLPVNADQCEESKTIINLPALEGGVIATLESPLGQRTVIDSSTGKLVSLE